MPLTTTGVSRTGWSTVQNCSNFSARDEPDRRLEWTIMPAAVLLQSNSAYPRQQQDGLRWAGRGLSASVLTGAAIRWGPVTAALQPTATYQQNDDYTIRAVTRPELSSYSSFYHVGIIDWPQRFGSSSFWWIHPGQSFLRVDAFRLKAGFSTENLRWGPGRRNPLLMSDAAGGFPHVFLGTEHPVDLRIASLGVEAIWGRLAESNHFDIVATNDTRTFAGIVATLTPKNSNVTLGLARAYVRTRPEGFSLFDEIFGPYTGVRDNPDIAIQGDNQLLSVFLSWVVPQGGFEVYGEYAREDHWEDALDLMMQLDHSRGYTFGLEKVFTLQGVKLLRVSGEATNLGMAPTWQSGRAGPTFYQHSQVVQGYTHRGQLLGAPIGPGSDAQYIAADYLTPELLAGLYYTRVRYDNDSYYRFFGFEYSNRGHDLEWTLGLRGGHVRGDLQAVLDLAYSARYNRGFVEMGAPGEYRRENNISISIGAAWTPNLRFGDQ
jgi:hypothetical protein